LAFKDDDKTKESITTMVDLIMFEWSSC